MILITINTCKYPIYSSSFLYHHKTTTQLTTNHIMKFSTAALTLSLFAIVNSSVTTYGAGFGGDDDDNSKHHKYDCEIDTYEWKFALAVKEWKHCQDKKFCQDTDLDLVYEGDDGQLYHGCDGTYPYSKCKHCTNVFTGGDDDDDNCDDDCKKKRKRFTLLNVVTTMMMINVMISVNTHTVKSTILIATCLLPCAEVF